MMTTTRPQWSGDDDDDDDDDGFIPPGAKHLKGNTLFTLRTRCSSQTWCLNKTGFALLCRYYS